MVGLYHCIDVDIKGFFDNVNHSKLLKQIWSFGIKDKVITLYYIKAIKSRN